MHTISSATTKRSPPTRSINGAIVASSTGASTGVVDKN